MRATAGVNDVMGLQVYCTFKNGAIEFSVETTKKLVQREAVVIQDRLGHGSRHVENFHSRRQKKQIPGGAAKFVYMATWECGTGGSDGADTGSNG